MYNPLDILDRALDNRTDLYNKAILSKIKTFGKLCTYYIIDSNELSENLNNEDIVNPLDNKIRKIDNYALAFGKNNVGFDYSKLPTTNAYIYADYPDFFKHDIGAEESVIFTIHVENTNISRGDIISYTIQHKQIFYRITEIITSYYDIVYKINTKLIQVKHENRKKPFVDLEKHKANLVILPDNGIVL